MNGKYKTIKSYRKDIVPEDGEAPVNPPEEYILNHTEYDENNNETREVTYHADGSVEQVTEYKYDAAGNLTEEFLYYENNEIADHRKYERDEKGNLLRELVYFNDDTYDTIHYKHQDSSEFGVRSSELKNQSDKLQTNKPLLIEKTTINSDGDTDEKEIFEYSDERKAKRENDVGTTYAEQMKSENEVGENYTEQGPELKKQSAEQQSNNPELLIRHAVFDSDNKKTSETTYKYDEAGKVAELTEWDSDTDKKFRTVNTYNENGILIKQLRYLKDNLIAKLVFEVDENNKVYEVLDEDTRHKNTLKISYDEKGNIIEEAEYDRNNELNHSIKRAYNENNDVTESIVFIDHRTEGYQENYRIRYDYE